MSDDLKKQVHDWLWSEEWTLTDSSDQEVDALTKFIERLIALREVEARMEEASSWRSCYENFEVTDRQRFEWSRERVGELERQWDALLKQEIAKP